MILVDVVCPELNRTIDFMLDETARGWEIAEEIATMAARNSGRSFQANEEEIMLYSMETKRKLDLNRSLVENNVRSGEKLLFI